MRVIDTLPDGIRYPLIGLGQVLLYVLAIALCAGFLFGIYFLGSFLLNHFSWYVFGGIFGPPILYAILYNIGKAA